MAQLIPLLSVGGHVLTSFRVDIVAAYRSLHCPSPYRRRILRPTLPSMTVEYVVCRLGEVHGLEYLASQRNLEMHPHNII